MAHPGEFVLEEAMDLSETDKMISLVSAFGIVEPGFCFCNELGLWSPTR
jgi:hypothetical protein